MFSNLMKNAPQRPQALTLRQNLYTGFQVFSFADKLLDEAAASEKAGRANAEL